MSHPFTFRPGSCDEEVFRAINVWNEYRLPPTFEPGDIIVDIGTHIGSFCHAALERGSHRVYGFEAFSKNFEHARRNLATYGSRVTVQNKAVWRSDTKVNRLTFTSLEGENNAAGHVVGAQGADGVEAIAFDDIVLELTENGRNRIKMVKLDCEGSEYTILFTSKVLHLVDSIVGEYHNYGDKYPYGPGEDHFFHKMPEHGRVRGHDRYTHDDLALYLRPFGFDVTVVAHPHLPTLAGWFYAYRVAPPSVLRDRIQWHWHGLKHKLTQVRKAG
jgi:FkbM family methyltransferase